MSASQTLILVALPNGSAGKGNLKLSLYLAPRLAGGATQTLADFPDFLTWPELIRSRGLKFELACGPNRATVAANPARLRPDVWQAIFTKETYVQSYAFPDFTGRLIVSYPARQVGSFLKSAYQTFGSQKRGDGNATLPPPFQALSSLVFREGHKSTLASEFSRMRQRMWGEQAGGELAPVAVTAVPQTPTGVTREAMTRFALFHQLPPAHNRPPLPTAPGGFTHTLDFHAALTALSSYPSLLRALGLVFDVEVPASLCPASPTAGGYGTIAVTKVSAVFSWRLAPRFSFPATSYWRDQRTFHAAPAAVPAAQAGGDYPAGDTFCGWLAMAPDNFHLQEVDLDGAGLKLLGLADNAAYTQFLAGQSAVNATNHNLLELESTLPALRSAGISLMADSRGEQLLQAIKNHAGFDQSLASGAPGPFNALDLARGYRIDIWSSRTGRWHSLHSRRAVYKFGPHGNLVIKLEEEGFTQLAAAQAAEDPTRKSDKFSTQNHLPQPDSDLYVHERVARWDGWSLSAPRPGGALNRSADPTKALDPDPTLGAPVTPFKMTTEFAPSPGSLPELRFGANYRLRVRTVDIAGNSLPLDTPFPAALNFFAAPAGGALMKYLRFEPVGPPLVVLRQTPQAGGSLERLVIRSANASPALDAQPTTATDQRHIAPPRVAVRLAEAHGVLDLNRKLDGRKATYEMIAARDKFEIPAKDKLPIEPKPVLEVGYLPDPIARGAALRDLPNTPSDTSGNSGPKGVRYVTLPDVDPRPGSVTYIDFGAQPWPDAAAFRLVLAEGHAAPQWDEQARTLTVSLPKAGVAVVPLSCYLQPADLDNLGVWSWLQESVETLEAGAMQTGLADLLVSRTSDRIAQGTRLVLEGGHEMITPARALTLVHAVQQPLGEPTFLQLPVVHQPTAPIFASALRNLFTPITAWRRIGSHEAVLLGGLAIHGASSAKIELHARWLEVTDDPTLPGPTEATASQAVETIDLGSLAEGPGSPTGWPIYSDASQTRRVAVYVPAPDVLWFSAPFDVLEGVFNPSTTEVAAPVHRFPDTRHRWVEYTPVATSRFQEYFPNQKLDFTRRGAMLVVDVPSSARPNPPDIAYVVPTFGWENQETSNIKTSVRYGGGLRVYLNRGWYSSGADELLAVVLWPGNPPAGVSNPPDAATWERCKALFSQWGNDPIWANGALAGSLPTVPSVGDFSNAQATATGLTVPETEAMKLNLTFDVAAYPVAYDAQRGLWYCDLEVQNAYAYAPFIRLALARYQSHSLQGVELSPVQLADFAQIAPDRSAVLSINPTDPRHARLFIGGLAPAGPVAPTIEVTIETRIHNIASDLDWRPAAAGVTVAEDTPAPAEASAVLWSGAISFAKAPSANQFRIVIREYENLPVDAPSGGLADPPVMGRRVVYAAILPYNYP